MIALLTFAAASLVAWYVLRPKNPALMRRRLGLESSAATTSERQIEGSLRERVILPTLGQVGGTIGRFLPHRLVGHVEHMLMVANSRMPATVFLGIWAASATFGLLLAYYLGLTTKGLSGIQLIGF